MTSCPRCGATAAQGQEYCLTCGALLAGHSARRTVAGWSEWTVRAGLLAVVAVAGAAGAIGATNSGGGGESLTTALGGFTTAPSATTLPGPGETAPAGTADWPAGVDGWTIVLGSFPQTEGRKAAETRARQARRRGLDQVGVLDSSRYASLHPGYWVVFAGVFGSEAEATSTLEATRKVTRNAAVRHVVA